jgi:hypothetical protein
MFLYQFVIVIDDAHGAKNNSSQNEGDGVGG